jgi:hypothetical protein
MDPFQDLFNQNVTRTQDGRYFLPFSKTYLGQQQMQQDVDESGTPFGEKYYRGGYDPESGFQRYSSLQDYFNATNPGSAGVLGPGAQNGIGINTQGMSAEQIAGLRGNYNGELGYYVDPNTIAGTHPATTAGMKPNEGGLWQMLSLLLPAVGGIVGAAGEAGAAGSSVGSSAFEGNVPAAAGSDAATGGSAIGGSEGSSNLTGSAARDTLSADPYGTGVDQFGNPTGQYASGSTPGSAGGNAGLTLDQALKAGGLAATIAGATQKPSMGTTTTTQVSDPWAGQQPYLNSLFQNAASLYGASGMSPETMAALQMQAARAQSGQSLTEAGQQEFGKTIAGDYLRPETNPYLKATLDNTFNDIQSRVAGTFGTRGGNNYGTSAHQEWLGRNLMEAASPLLNQNYQTERSRQLNAAQLAPSMAYADIAPLAQVGAAKEAYPWDQLAKYQSAISGNYGGTSQTTSPYFKANPYLNALGAGIGAVGLYGMGQQAGLWGGLAGTTSNPYTTGNLGSGLNASGSGWGTGWGF